MKMKRPRRTWRGMNAIKSQHFGSIQGGRTSARFGNEEPEYNKTGRFHIEDGSWVYAYDLADPSAIPSKWALQSVPAQPGAFILSRAGKLLDGAVNWPFGVTDDATNRAKPSAHWRITYDRTDTLGHRYSIRNLQNDLYLCPGSQSTPGLYKLGKQAAPCDWAFIGPVGTGTCSP
jgi:hypothetical protein